MIESLNTVLANKIINEHAVSTDLKIRKSNASLEFFLASLLFGLRHCSKVPIFPKLIEDLRGKIPS